MGNSDGSDHPVCPHCNEPHEEWYDSGGFELHLNDQDETDITCTDCGKRFVITVTVHVVRYYDSKMKEVK